MSDEEQRQRVKAMVRREKDADCPQLVVLGAEAILGGGLVHYRCKEGDPPESLKLTPEAAEYVGIDMSEHDQPETGGWLVCTQPRRSGILGTSGTERAEEGKAGKGTESTEET